MYLILIGKLKLRRGARFRPFLTQRFRQKAARPYKCESRIDTHGSEEKCQSETAVKHNLLCLFADHYTPIDRKQKKSIRQMPCRCQNANDVDHHYPNDVKFAGDD